MRRKNGTLGAVIAAAIAMIPAGPLSVGAIAQGNPNAGRVAICHLTGNGRYQLITVNQNALDAHLRHGDARPGEVVDGRQLGQDCSLPEAETIRVESPPLSFGPFGWGGWSCPAGTVAVSGGYEPASATVLVAQVAGPGSSWPHYVFGPNESGFVVQNGSIGQTLTIYILCQTQ